MKSLSEALKEARTILQNYAKGEQSTWKPQAEAFLKTLRGNIESHDGARKLIQDFCLSLRWGYQQYLGSSGGSSLKAQLEALLATIPTSAEYEKFLSANPQAKLNSQTITHTVLPSSPLVHSLQDKKTSHDTAPPTVSMRAKNKAPSPLYIELSESSSSEDEADYSFPLTSNFFSFLCLGDSQEHARSQEDEEKTRKEDTEFRKNKVKHL